MKREFWISNRRFVIIAVILLLMWAWIMLFLYLKADEITKNPCSVCAKKMGETVKCTVMEPGLESQTLVFYPNLTVVRVENVGQQILSR
jgi:hypothetical protein